MTAEISDPLPFDFSFGAEATAAYRGASVVGDVRDGCAAEAEEGVSESKTTPDELNDFAAVWVFALDAFFLGVTVFTDGVDADGVGLASTIEGAALFAMVDFTVAVAVEAAEASVGAADGCGTGAVDIDDADAAAVVDDGPFCLRTLTSIH
jgi:hypothetical protein